MMEHAGIIILKGMSGLVVGTWENSEQTVYVTSISLIPVVWKMNNAVSQGYYTSMFLEFHSIICWLAILVIHSFIQQIQVIVMCWPLSWAPVMSW